MKQITEPDQAILKITKQELPPTGTEMKLSQYTLRFELSGKTACFNTLTKECLILGPDEIIPDSFIYEPNKFKDYLIQHRFCVNKDTNETETYCSLLSLLRSFDIYRGLKAFTILPTTFCNARCFYCYELNYQFCAMSSETADRVISLIETTHADQEIQLIWFGGEPLMGSETIRRITHALKDKNIAFKSEMVTNCSLFNESLIKEAKEEWKLKKVQITLDGDEAEYNKRKNYFDSSGSPFMQVIRNIKMLQKAGIRISLRLNIDYDNLKSMQHLAERLDDLFEDKSIITVNVYPLYSLQAGSSCTDIWSKALEIERLYRAKGFKTPSKRGLSRLKQYFCMADNPSHVVINSDGMIYSCEHCLVDSRIGTLDVIPQKNTKKTVIESDIREKCRCCAFLPDCTDFKDCPDLKYDCYGIHYMKLADTLTKKMENGAVSSS